MEKFDSLERISISQPKVKLIVHIVKTENTENTDEEKQEEQEKKEKIKEIVLEFTLKENDSVASLQKRLRVGSSSHLLLFYYFVNLLVSSTKGKP
jgi:Ran GTPase-activating protein (RanGAP) involved in mRNA processing and transport